MEDYMLSSSLHSVEIVSSVFVMPDMFTMTDWRFLSGCSGKSFRNDIGDRRWMVLESRSVFVVCISLLFNHYYTKK